MFSSILCLENTVHYFHVMVGWQVDRQSQTGRQLDTDMDK